MIKKITKGLSTIREWLLKLVKKMPVLKGQLSSRIVQTWQKAEKPRRIATIIGAWVLRLSILYVLTIHVPELIQQVVPPREGKINITALSIDTIPEASKKISAELKKIQKNLDKKIPKSYYLIINSALNEFSLYKGTTLSRKGKCSTGSYIQLESENQQKWLFKTPKGEFRILGKKASPVWHKPDWAFVEEGLPVPPPGHPSRYEYGVLGDYALSLGQGYMIHGTLYQRFLGLPVTHGCVRMNDEDLEAVYYALNIGSKVYIY